MTPTALTAGGFLALGLMVAPHYAMTCGLVFSGTQPHARQPAPACGRCVAVALSARQLVLVALGMLTAGVGATAGAWLPIVMMSLAAGLGLWVALDRLRSRSAATTRSIAGLGAAMALLPCPVFYGVLGYVVLTGDVLQGGLLAGSFALGSAVGVALVMIAASWVAPRLSGRVWPRLRAGMTAAGLLLALGLAWGCDWGRWLCQLG